PRSTKRIHVRPPQPSGHGSMGRARLEGLDLREAGSASRSSTPELAPEECVGELTSGLRRLGKLRKP
ncbi:MAG: hypothetical protein JRN17_05180, partial [Nitrososphaerota archaeon]|nr:hypothetical protein [Nitrososphaerota archaeon]